MNAQNLRSAGERQSVLSRENLDPLVSLLRRRGYEVVAPTVRDGAILYDRVESLAHLPSGWGDDQEAGRYRLRRRSDEALFGYASTTPSWKRFLHPPNQHLCRISRQGEKIEVSTDPEVPRAYAFLGVRPCDLRALMILDRVFLQDRYADAGYRARRDRLFVAAVNCAEPSPVCFCASMGTGPAATEGYDLLMSEILEGGHRFVMEAGTPAGEEVLAELGAHPAGPADREAAERLSARARSALKRSVEMEGIKDRIYAADEHPRWKEVAARCLACANCTLVCPTCFCTTVDDTTDVSVQQAERWRRWDSCFTLGFSYIHGGSIRTSVAARYRQWLTHKLASWQDQFGSPGCVGCGRCITWCPAGIDITEEARALRSRSKEE
jgi:formate hydrogenlyase subunit 6/NADH:ubiquinone oxidoreductase subunit I